ncbi:unnamed protein product [Cylicostephanus goldi]|uniref:SHSP domain-containing protein n=1 Tax=Cylicostephanus goldi TaxID=71465 RepID=A0A3P6SLA7_CYLGO|nr:unnamed protein product [Cylicostephanus goldi]
MAAADIVVKRDKVWDWPLQKNDEFVKVVEDSKHFEVGLDARLFTPKEIQVKMIGEDLIQVKMEHEAQKGDVTNVSRNIMRSANTLV